MTEGKHGKEEEKKVDEDAHTPKECEDCEDKRHAGKSGGAGKRGGDGKEDSGREELLRKIAELTEIIQRTQSDYENYRKRVERDKQEFIDLAGKDIISKLLPVLDNFNLTLRNKQNKDECIKGMEMTFNEMREILEKEGLKPIKAEGETFDPLYHEALLAEESDRKEGTILQEIQRGYMFKDKVIRTAKVKISKGKEDKKEEDKDQ
ncbi:MAG: nucleotide exchange factor GrpE [Candidatus Woesearchaeota archaeon]